MVFRTVEHKGHLLQKPSGVLLQKPEVKTCYRTQTAVLPVLCRGFVKIVQLCIVLGVVLSVIVPVNARVGVTVDRIDVPVPEVDVQKTLYSLPVKSSFTDVSGIPTVEQWNCLSGQYLIKNREACLEVRQIELCDEPTFLVANQLYCEALRTIIRKQQFECVRRVGLEVFPEECVKEVLFTEKLQQKCLNTEFFTLHRTTCEDNIFYIVMLKQQQCSIPNFFIHNRNICEETRLVLHEQTKKCELSTVFLFGHQQSCEHLNVFLWQIKQGAFPYAQQGIYQNVGLPVGVNEGIYDGMVTQGSLMKDVLSKVYNKGIFSLSPLETLYGRGMLPLTTGEAMHKGEMLPLTTGSTMSNGEIVPLMPYRMQYNKSMMPLKTEEVPFDRYFPMMSPKESIYNKPAFA